MDFFPVKVLITKLKLNVLDVPGSPVINSGILFKIHIDMQKQFSLSVLFLEIIALLIPRSFINQFNSPSITKFIKLMFSFFP